MKIRNVIVVVALAFGAAGCSSSGDCVSKCEECAPEGTDCATSCAESDENNANMRRIAEELGCGGQVDDVIDCLGSITGCELGTMCDPEQQALQTCLNSGG